MDPIQYTQSETDEDLLPIVDDEDRVIGSATRREVHTNRLKHRSVHVIIVNSRGEILLQKRSTKKDSFGGWWDISVGGHVDVGEDYDAAARRELFEEMGVDAPFREIGRRLPCEDNGWEFVRIYECRHDGPVRPDPNEIESVRWELPRDILEKARFDESNERWRMTMSGLTGIRMWAECTKAV